jgi:nucleotide-binding universal stress UspA family protein
MSEILVGVDGSPQSDTAVQWAAARAGHTGARLRLLHALVLPLPTPAMPLATAGAYGVEPHEYATEAGRAVLGAARELALRHQPGIDVVTETRVGGAAPALIEASADADLVVVGSRGLGGFTGLLLGSVGTQVTGHAQCPAVVIHGEPTAGGPVVVGVDGSEPGAAALAFAFAEAGRLGARLVAVHAWTMPLPTGPAEAAAVGLATDSDRAAYRQAAEQVLNDALAGHRAQHPDVPVDARAVEGGTAGALLDAASGAAIVVVGSRGRGGFTGLLLGSTSQSVLHHATCPVAVLRA